MLYGALSHDCFHCVDYRYVHGPAEAREFITGVAGTVCAICSTRTETFEVLIDRQEYEDWREDRGTWDKAVPPGTGFAGFAKATGSPVPGTSPAAEALRGELTRAAAAKRRAVLEKLTERVQADVCLAAGVKAWQAGQTDEARRALKVCARTGKPQAKRAAFLLGDIARKTGDRQTAARRYAEAASSGDPEVRAPALLMLGECRELTGDLAGSIEAYRACVTAGPSVSQGLSAFRLGTVLTSRGDITGAQSAYETAYALRDPLSSPQAALNLGALDEDLGRWREATGCWEYAFSAGDGEVRALAAFNLARAWERRKRWRKARRFYEIALGATDRDIAARARAALDSH